MNLEEDKNSESLKNSEESTLTPEQLVKRQQMVIQLLREQNNYRDESYFRMVMMESLGELNNSIKEQNNLLKEQNQKLGSMINKMSNQNKILAGHLGVAIE